MKALATALLWTATAMVLASGPAAADVLTRQQAKAMCEPQVQTGPRTPYGETAAETANKQIVFAWNCLSMVDGNAKDAFARYVNPQWCDHSHLLTGGQRDCASYDESQRMFTRMADMFNRGDTLEVPVMASVNGDMVTMYGTGVDIFRVQDGKITDHWDASPPAEISLKAHAPGFEEWVWGERKGPPPSIAGATPTSMLVDQAVLTSINVGPMTPYAETRQEAANKRIVFLWNHQSMIQGKPREAIEKYLDPSFCDHSHMMTRGRKACASREELLGGPIGAARPAAKAGDRVIMPHMATVNGDMVTMYGEGVDIFRVRNGRITDHWDASPPRAVTVKAHDIDMVERMIKVVAGELPLAGPGGPPAP